MFNQYWVGTIGIIMLAMCSLILKPSLVWTVSFSSGCGNSISSLKLMPLAVPGWTPKWERDRIWADPYLILPHLSTWGLLSLDSLTFIATNAFLYFFLNGKLLPCWKLDTWVVGTFICLTFSHWISTLLVLVLDTALMLLGYKFRIFYSIEFIIAFTLITFLLNIDNVRTKCK